MRNEYVTFQKFTDLESAELILNELKQNGIDCHILNNNHAYVSVVGYNQIDFAVGLNIRQGDFMKAEEVLERFYGRQLDNIGKDYYLFGFTTEELTEILHNPLEWGQLDYQLATRVLAGRGVHIGESDLLKAREEKLAEMAKTQPISKTRLILYYLFCFILPPYAMINGFLIVNGGTTLPNGQKVFERPESDRKHGRIIIGLSIAVTLTFVLWAFKEKY